MHDLSRRAQGVDIASAGHTLEFLLNRMGDLAKFKGADVRVLRLQGGGHNGHFVDTFGLDDRLADAQRGLHASWLAAFSKLVFSNMLMHSVGFKRRASIPFDGAHRDWTAALGALENALFSRPVSPSIMVAMVKTVDAAPARRSCGRVLSRTVLPRWPWLVALALALASCAVKPPPIPDPEFADRVVVRKSDRTLQLLHENRVFREYPINLGRAPKGHKVQEGDKRTPEGEYILDWRNPRSQFFKSINISYPNHADREFAWSLGVNPGNLIMIHGRPNRLAPGMRMEDYDKIDWTDGCIAVRNEAMEEIWNKVRNGTPITILP